MTAAQAIEINEAIQVKETNADRVAQYLLEERWEDMRDLLAGLESGQLEPFFLHELEALRADAREFIRREDEEARRDS